MESVEKRAVFSEGISLSRDIRKALLRLLLCAPDLGPPAFFSLVGVGSNLGEAEEEEEEEEEDMDSF